MLKIFKLIVSCALIAGIIYGGVFLYRKFTIFKSCNAELVATAQSNILNTGTGNPYENPNDPNTNKQNGTIFSTGMMTGYYLDLDISGLSIEIDDYAYARLIDNDLVEWLNPTTYTFTAIITFSNVKYNDLPVCISAPISVKIPNRWSCVFRWQDIILKLNNGFSENSGNFIRLPAAYYNFLKYEEETNGNNVCGKVQFVFTFNGNQAISSIGTQSCTYRLYTKDIPLDSDDPTSPNFDLGAFGGLMAQIKEGCGSMTLGDWIMTFAFLLVASGLISLITAIVKGVFGKG